ncbi:MAG: aminotransferase class V-fold PLP-dependent enzyme [Gemmatimonadales bacterium]|nr:aminotransferase class V-fold PLP-dependent enzyme [Gemmatimonadales bacterium]
MRGSRRDFLSTLGTAAVAGALPSTPPGRPLPPRGLAPDPADFLFDPGLHYLQTGSLGPTPRPVLEQTVAFWRDLERNPTAVGYGAQEQAMDAVRARAATFLGCGTDELVLTRCTTDGMNQVAQGLRLGAGDRVLTTDQEHPGGRSGWDYLARTAGVGIDVVPIAPEEHDPTVLVARFAERITPRTRVLSFSHLLSSTGLRMPVRELSLLARDRGCLAVVDGAQAAGGVAVDVKALGCHAYATSGHKWMLGPKGTGLLYLSAELGTRVDPIQLQGGRAAYSASSGVTSLPSVLGLGVAMDYLDAIGLPAIEAHNLALRERGRAGLARLPRVTVVGAPEGAQAAPLLSYRLPPEVEAHRLYQALLQRHQVMVKVVPGGWFNGQRISTHLFNTAADVDALLAALAAELGGS